MGDTRSGRRLAHDICLDRRADSVPLFYRVSVAHPRGDARERLAFRRSGHRQGYPQVRALLILSSQL